MVGFNILAILGSLGWVEDRQNHSYIPCLDSHLSLVLGARSSAIAFPGRPGLTRNRFSPLRITPSWGPQSSASRKQILVVRGWSAEPPATSLSPRQRSRRCSPAPAQCARSLRQPLPGGSLHQTSLGKQVPGMFSSGSRSRFPERGRAKKIKKYKKNAFGDPREPSGFRKRWGALIEVLFFREFLNLEAWADNKKRTQAKFRRTETATNNQEAARLGAVPSSPLSSRGPLPGSLRRVPLSRVAFATTWAPARAHHSGAAMSSDFEGYEQDFAVLTAEITSKIARVPRLPPGESPDPAGRGWPRGLRGSRAVERL